MAIKAGVTVEGAAQLRRTLKAAGDDLSDLTQAHRQVGTFVAQAAEPRVPRRSGALAATARAGAAKTNATVRYGGGRVRYARPIHWGWPRRNIPAQPWAYQTAIDTRPQWTALYTAAVNRVLARIRGA